MLKIDLIGEFCGENCFLCSLEEILSTLIADVSKVDLDLPLDSCLFLDKDFVVLS